MSLLSAAARSVILQPLAETATAAARRSLMPALLWGGTLFTLMLVLAFASAASYLALAEVLSPALAALTAAGGLLLLAAAAAGLAWRSMTTKSPAPTPAVRPTDARAELVAMIVTVGLAVSDAIQQGRQRRP